MVRQYRGDVLCDSSLFPLGFQLSNRANRHAVAVLFAFADAQQTCVCVRGFRVFFQPKLALATAFSDNANGVYEVRRVGVGVRGAGEHDVDKLIAPRDFGESVCLGFRLNRTSETRSRSNRL